MTTPAIKDKSLVQSATYNQGLATKEPTLTAGTIEQYYRGDKTWQALDKTAIGLSNVDNTSDANKPISTAVATALGNKVNTSTVGAANGIAQLDATGKVPATQLPSYVGDVLEYTNLAAFPATGESGKIYITLDNNDIYRWSGTGYIKITASSSSTDASSTDAVPEGTINKYYTDTRASSAAPVQSVAGKTGVVTLVKGDIGLGNVDNTSDADKPISIAVANVLGDISAALDAINGV